MYKIYIVKYKETPKSKVATVEVSALSSIHAKHKIKYENEVTRNQISFISIRERHEQYK